MTAPGSSPLAPRQSTPSKPSRGGGRRLLLGIALVALVVVSGVWLMFLRPEGRGPRPKPSRITPSPTATPTPPLDPQTSDDFETAFRAIYAKRTSAVVNRRPELVDQIYLPDCNCYELKSLIEQSIQRGGHHVGYDPKVTSVERIKEGINGPLLTTVRVVTEQDPYTIVDDNTGTVILHDPGWTSQSSAWELHRSSPGSPWMVGFLLVEGPVTTTPTPLERPSS
jgi:hypothetical protein